MKFLVTGAAGFIGYHTCKALLDRGDEVIGIGRIDSDRNLDRPLGARLDDAHDTVGNAGLVLCQDRCGKRESDHEPGKRGAMQIGHRSSLCDEIEVGLRELY